MNTTRIVMVILLVGSVANAGEQIRNPSKDRTAHKWLSIVAEAEKQNREKIGNWQGRAVVEDRVLNEGDKSTETTKQSSVDFLFDRKRKSIRWHWEIRNWTDVTNGRRSDQPCPQLKSGMKTRDAFYRLPFGFIRPMDDPPHRLIIYPIEKERLSPRSADFDPVWYFTEHGEFVADRVSGLARHVFKPDSGWTVKREENIVSVEYSENGLVNRYRFSLTSGGNIVSYHGSSARLVNHYHWTYEQCDGIWLPKTWTWTNAKKWKEGAPTDDEPYRIASRKVTFTDNAVNQNIRDADFSLQALGVMQGDIVMDTRTNERYRFGGETNLVK